MWDLPGSPVQDLELTRGPMFDPGWGTDPAHATKSLHAYYSRSQKATKMQHSQTNIKSQGRNEK